MRISTQQYQQLSLNALLDQQGRLAKVQQQIASGRRILTPADDPTGAARSLVLAGSIGALQSYSQSADQIEPRIQLEESNLTQVQNVLQRLRELAVQANNATQTAADRQLIGAEVREDFTQLVQLANATDGNDGYLFAGLQSRTQPFLWTGNAIAYQGDQGQRLIQIGPQQQVATTHSGYEVFMKIRTGDGQFAATAASANTGSGVITPVTVTDPNALAGSSYTLAFDTNASGALTYTLAKDGTPATTQIFNPGEPIRFDGLSVSIEGTPAKGDQFTVQPSGFQSLFDTVNRFATALETAQDGAGGQAAYQNIGNQTLQNLDQALDHILTLRAQIGGRLNALDSGRDANEAAVLNLQTTKSGVDDLDYASAITELYQHLIGLQAAQQSYAKIQGLSLFNYL